MKRSLLALGASAVALSSMALAPSVKVAEGAPFFFDASQQKETQAVASPRSCHRPPAPRKRHHEGSLEGELQCLRHHL